MISMNDKYVTPSLVLYAACHKWPFKGHQLSIMLQSYSNSLVSKFWHSKEKKKNEDLNSRLKCLSVFIKFDKFISSLVLILPHSSTHS